MQSPDHFPSWLSQRRDGKPAPVKEHRAMGKYPKTGEPSTIGAWPAVDTVRLWDQLPTRRDSWPLVLVFNGRVLTRFPYRVRQDGTLVSREVPRFTHIDKVVTLTKVDDWWDADIKWMSLSIVFNQEWTSYE
eukprot:1409685-Pyramimonas_sp.AAC.1